VIAGKAWFDPDLSSSSTAAAVEAANLTAYTDRLRAERGLDLTTYPELWRWSVEDPGAFWDSILDHYEVAYDGERTVALASEEMPGAVWFPGDLPQRKWSRGSGIRRPWLRCADPRIRSV